MAKVYKIRLYYRNLNGLGAFLALYYLKLYFLTFGKCFKTLTNNAGVMYEIILSITRGNKSKTLLVVKPFDFALCHTADSCNFVTG